MGQQVLNAGASFHVRSVVSDVNGVAVTSGLTATAEILDWESGVSVDGPDAMSHISGGLWDVNMPALAAGVYRVVIDMSIAGETNTVRGQLKVSDDIT